MTGKVLRATLGLVWLAALACALPPLPFVPTATPQCPHATPEPLWVSPVPATTDQTSIVVEVVIGNGDQVLVATEGGTYVVNGDFSTANPAQVEVTLLPGVTHHLEVSGRVKRVTNASGCSYGGYTLHATTDRNGAPLVIAQTSPTSEVGDATPTLCPQGTPEPLWVTPLPATTDQTSITVEVIIGNGEEVTITTESGTFTAQGDFSTANPAEVEVTLLPGVTHHLEVSGRVKQMTGFGGCPYGGYTLHTTRDRDGGELVIQQTSSP